MHTQQDLCTWVFLFVFFFLPVIVGVLEGREDVPEAAVAVKLGLALGAFDGAFQPSAQEALDRKQQRHANTQLMCSLTKRRKKKPYNTPATNLAHL